MIQPQEHDKNEIKYWLLVQVCMGTHGRLFYIGGSGHCLNLGRSKLVILISWYNLVCVSRLHVACW